MSLDAPSDQDIIIVGVTGDLARRKLLPALYNLHAGKLLPESGKIFGYARTPWNDHKLREMAEESITEFSRTGLDKAAWKTFAQRLQFVPAEPDGFAVLKKDATQKERLVYLAVPPSTFPTVIGSLGKADLAKGTRVIVEKPFGRDLASARQLHNTLHSVFPESQIFRIDHYLGKETVQNILVFRLGNSVFERVWNRDAIDHVQVTVAEEIGIEGRGSFYEETGALRDIVQNHVFQVLSLLTMEPPSAFHGEAVRDEKTKLFQAMQPVRSDDVVRGQYTRGKSNGDAVPGYREETGVKQESSTETYIAMKLSIDNWRWAGVPFFIRTGKRLPRRTTQIDIAFKEAPVSFFRNTAVEKLPGNRLSLLIQPDEGITFSFQAKLPGPEIHVQPVQMEFSYSEQFVSRPAEAYERLIHDAMDGDQTLFARGDMVERSWEVVQAVIDETWPVYSYPAGSWGPEAADTLLSPRTWYVK